METVGFVRFMTSLRTVNIDVHIPGAQIATSRIPPTDTSQDNH